MHRVLRGALAERRDRFCQRLSAVVVLALASASAFADVLELTPRHQPHNPVPYLQYLRDPAGAFSLQEVVAADQAGRFTSLPHDDEAVNFGFDHDVIWYRLHLRDLALGADQRWVLEVGYNLLNVVEIHVENDAGGFSRSVSGNTVPDFGQILNNRNFTFVLDLSPERETTVYIKAQTDTSLLLSMELWQQQRYAAKLARDNLWFGAFFGVMLAMALYNLLIVSAVREATYLYYIGYILSGAAFYFVLNGFARQLFGAWPAGWWPLVPMLIGVQSLLGLLFAQSFLKTRRNAPGIHRVLLVLLMIIVASVIVVAFVPVSLGLQWVSYQGAFMACAILAVGVLEARRGVKMARLFVAAFGLFAIGVLLKVFAAAGLLASGFWSTYGMQMGQAADVILLSLALADRINLARREREESRVATLQALRSKDAAVVAERERLIRDLHDDIGAKMLNIIHGPADEEDKQFARDALSGIRALKLAPQDVARPLTDVLALMRLEFDERLLRAGIEPVWEQPDALDERPLSSPFVAHLSSLLRELVSNAIKHAGAQQVNCRVALKDQALTLHLEDDGSDARSERWQEGKGLATIRERARQLHARLQLSVAPSGGLAVQLAVPLPTDS